MTTTFPFFISFHELFINKNYISPYFKPKMIQEYKYSSTDIKIEVSEIEELIGYEKGEAPESIVELIDQALIDSQNFCNFRGGFRILDDVVINTSVNSIQINDLIFYPGKIVTTHLKNSTSVALFICTAGADISEHSNKTAVEGDPLLGYIFDVIGSVMAEKVTEKIQDKIVEFITGNGLKISDRFSPGYCDWSVSEQQKLFSLLPKNFCGITLSENSLMNPIKSVSGIIGIGTANKQLGYQCNWCNDLNCIYGKVKRQKKL